MQDKSSSTESDCPWSCRQGSGAHARTQACCDGMGSWAVHYWAARAVGCAGYVLRLLLLTKLHSVTLHVGLKLPAKHMQGLAGHKQAGRPAHPVPGEPAHLKQLDISVEEVTLGDVDLLQAQLMHQAQDARGDGCFSAAGYTEGDSWMGLLQERLWASILCAALPCALTVHTGDSCCGWALLGLLQKYPQNFNSPTMRPGRQASKHLLLLVPAAAGACVGCCCCIAAVAGVAGSDQLTCTAVCWQRGACWCCP